MFSDISYIDKMCVCVYIGSNRPAKPLSSDKRNLAGVFMGLNCD